MISEHLINAIKTSFACLIGFLVARLLNLESNLWLIITIIVVMTTQISVGGTLQKSYLRFLGTLSGALIAMITLSFFKQNEFIMQCIIIISVFGFSYLVALSPGVGQAWAMGAVTVAVLLLLPNRSTHIALLRLEEILLGIVIALIVNIIAFPISATKKLKKLLAENLNLSADYYKSIVDGDAKKNQEIEAILMDNFIIAKILFDEAKFEPKMDQKFYSRLLYHEKRLFRAISLMEHYFASKPEKKEGIVKEYNIILEVMTGCQKILKGKQSELVFDKTTLNDLKKEKENFLLNFISQEMTILISLIKPIVR